MARPVLSRPIVALFLALAVLIAGGFFVYSRRTSDNMPGSDNNTVAEDGTQFPGPTDQELKETEANKERLANQGNSTPAPSGSKRGVTPVITSANAGEIRSYVSGVVEDNGSCTATFTQGEKSFSKTSTGIADASTTVCGVIRLARADFPAAGRWSVTVSYDSQTSEGKSDAATVVVP